MQKRSSRSSGPERGRKTDGKVGSDPNAVRKVGGKGDFGARSDDRVERDYVSKEIKRQDPGGSHVRIKTEDSARESGVGANEDGPGSGSGGDLDTDIVGVGTGGTGISQSGPDDRQDGPDFIKEEANKVPARRGKRSTEPQKSHGTTVDRTGGDSSTTGAGAGAAAVTNPNVIENDAFVGEISGDEARGADNGPGDQP